MRSQNTVIYDGLCGICTTSARWVQQRDKSGRLKFVAYQSANLPSIAPGLTEKMASRSLYFVGRDGRRYKGARAIFETLRQLPGAWRVIGAFGAFPPISWLGEPFYYLVAANRERISVWLGLSACAVE